MTDLATLDATGQAELVRTGQASPVELVDAAIDRIDRLNPELNAVIHHRAERAREEARGPLPDGPFRGVPILFKDLNCSLAGEPWHWGTQALKDAGYRAPATANLARRFTDAGFVCVGRTNTPEFGLVPTTEPYAYGPTRNPWDLTRTTGGSSGGSAAAVAAGLVPIAHANDGGGSIRIPASCCGLVGLKPSRGRSSYGPLADQLTDILAVELVVTRSVRDTAAALDVVWPPFPGDTVIAPPPARPYVDELAADPGRLRVGILTHNPLGTGVVHPECVRATEAIGRELEALGHHVEPDHPTEFEEPELVGQFTNLWAGSLAFTVQQVERMVGRPLEAGDVEPLTWALTEMGRAVSAAQLLDAIDACTRLSHRVAPWFEEHDLMLTPTLGAPPEPLGTFDTPDEPLLGFMKAAEFVPYTPACNIAGLPAISLPTHMTPDGLPVGIHLVAAFGREDLLLRVAAQLEAAVPWHDRRPGVHASS